MMVMKTKQLKTVFIFTYGFLIYYMLNYFIYTQSGPPISQSRNFGKTHFLQNFHFKNATNDRGKNLLTDASGKKIILLSLGRSGSSWISNLMSSEKNSFYFFEPTKFFTEWLSENSKENDNSTFKEFINSQYDCQLFTRYGPLHFVHMCCGQGQNIESKLKKEFTTNKCNETDEEFCFARWHLIKKCKEASNHVMKVINVKLEDSQILLDDKSLKGFKVVYLVRDPRANLLSRKRFGMIENRTCNYLQNDILSYRRLKSEYPTRIYFLRYEDMCRNPIEEATALWKFIDGNEMSEIPSSWLQYLSSSLTKKKLDDEYGLTRNTSSEWQNWRKEFKNQKWLTQIENECRLPIQSLGYSFYGTLENLMNINDFPSLTVENKCPTIPC